MVGRTVSELFPSAASRRSAPTPALEVGGLAAPGLQEASFSLRRGEVLGIFGLMGSGRTEMVRALFGLARPARRERARPRARSARSPAPPRRGSRTASAT